MDVSYADPAVATFIAIPALLLLALVWGSMAAWRRGGARPQASSQAGLVVGTVAFVWMVGTWAAAQAGVFQNWHRNPPPFALLVAAIVVLSLVIAYSSLGSHLARFLPLWVLVGVQGFRLPLELAMHAMYERGIMPREMSYSGRNFDIVTGATAIIVAVLVARGLGGRQLVAVWNIVGLALLVNVVTVAILGTPRFQYFGNDRLNTWVTYPPFVWLPAVMVLAALAGHLIIFRALRIHVHGRRS
jgi:hypothetical protein